MTKKARTTADRFKKKRDPESIKKFLDELSWVLSAHSNLDFKAIGESFSSQANLFFNKRTHELTEHIPDNPNIHFLVGALPGIFTDEAIFPTNEHIADFSRNALGIILPRWDKKSRYELIGLIVCNTQNLNDRRLGKVVKVLSKITSGDARARNILLNSNEEHLSWNEIIQKLTQET